MPRALALTVLLVAATLAGCASPPNTSRSFSITRIVHVHLDDANVDLAGEGNVYRFVTSSFVVHIADAPVAASALTLSYTDRDGKAVSKPLSAFTTADQLAPGAEVAVDDANITSDATLALDGATVASRGRAVQDWWKVEGYPIGARFDPGAALSYEYTGSASEGYHIKDVTTTTDPAFRLDDLLASVGFQAKGTTELVYDGATSTVQAAASHVALPLKWSTAGSVSFPMKLTATGRNVSSGEAMDAGFEVLEGTGATFEANGKLWWNASHEPVRADLDGGSYHVSADAIAWANGIPGVDGDSFSCAGKTRADRCHPTEMGFQDLNKTERLDPTKTNLDEMPWNVDPAVLANVTRFLSEDLVPGDELRLDVDLDSAHIDQGPDAPKYHIVITASLRAVDEERASVGAGEFDAIKLVERADMKATIEEAKQDGKVIVKPVTIDQRFADTTFYLAKDTFVPLRFEQTTPLDLDAIADALIAAVPAETWASAKIQPLKPEDLDLSLQAKTTVELTHLAGNASFSPWAVLLGFHSIGLAPAMLAQSSLGGLASELGATGSPAYPDAPPPPPPHPVKLALASAAPATNDTKDYRVERVTPDATYFDLSFVMDGEALYRALDGTGWCVVADDECSMESGYGPIQEGDVLRFTYPEIRERTLVVTDSWTDTVVLSMVVG